MLKPFEAFHPADGLVSVIGSGGKTALMRRLSETLSGSVILTTSTHILPFPEFPLVETGSDPSSANRERVRQELCTALARNRIVCLGMAEPSGKLASPSRVLPFEDLLLLADHILVEADGSAGRPLKAHRPWEPVIPACSAMTVCVVGASGIGKPISEVCHCPELFAALAGTTPDDLAKPEHIAAVLNREALADCYLVNQTDSLPDQEPALRLCSLISRDTFPCSVGKP